jgi:AcrR family transcriptional regulator
MGAHEVFEGERLSPAGRTQSEARRDGANSMRLRDARGWKTMRALHDALIDLIQDQPLERLTVDAIVLRAGVGRATFYRHYSTREQLMDEIGTDEIDRLLDIALPRFSRADPLAGSLAVAEYVNENKRLWSVLLTGGAAGVMRRRFAHLAQMRGALLDDGSADDLPLDLCAAWGMAGTVEILAWWLRQDDPVPVEKVAQYLERLTVRPALPNATGR